MDSHLAHHSRVTIHSSTSKGGTSAKPCGALCEMCAERALLAGCAGHVPLSPCPCRACVMTSQGAQGVQQWHSGRGYCRVDNAGREKAPATMPRTPCANWGGSTLARQEKGRGASTATKTRCLRRRGVVGEQSEPTSPRLLVQQETSKRTKKTRCLRRRGVPDELSESGSPRLLMQQETSKRSRWQAVGKGGSHARPKQEDNVRQFWACVCAAFSVW